MSDKESTPAPLGASDALILAENSSWEVENAPLRPGSDEGAGSSDGVVAFYRSGLFIALAALAICHERPKPGPRATSAMPMLLGLRTFQNALANRYNQPVTVGHSQVNTLHTNTK